MSASRSLLVPVLALVLGFTAGAVRAQTPAPAPAPSVTKSSCNKPEAFPGRAASETQKQTWLKDVTTWQGCVRAYVKEQQTLADAYSKAANTAVEEFNAAIKEFNEQQQAAAR